MKTDEARIADRHALFASWLATASHAPDLLIAIVLTDVQRRDVIAGLDSLIAQESSDQPEAAVAPMRRTSR